MRNFHDLKVWAKAHQLTLAVYACTQTFPKEELFGLTSQIRRACASIPANLAEGCGKGSNPDLLRFLHIAMGSASELEYHLILVRDLGLLRDADCTQLAGETIEVKHMLTSFIQRLKADS